MRILTAFTLLGFFMKLVTADADDDDKAWEEWKAKYGKSYERSLDGPDRKQIFLENKKMIDEHNLQFDQGLVTFTMKMNHLADMYEALPYSANTLAEIMSTMTGHRPRPAGKGDFSGSVRPRPTARDSSPLPTSVDWRDKGAVTEVKNQKRCGSCWAFATVGAVEGQNFLKTGKLVSLSEQNLVDCSSNSQYHNVGCKGGWADRAMTYIMDNGGIDTEDSYPYQATKGTCNYTSNNTGATVTGVYLVQRGNETALMEAVANVGPVVITINANTTKFVHPGKGVVSDPSCRNDIYSLTHEVLLVGYGHDDATDQNYWLVKNSWGKHYGDEGYVRIAKDQGNMLGVATYAVYPTV